MGIRDNQPGITVASAQFTPVRGNISANLDIHCHLTNAAARNGADVIVFPEMSITGYERKEAGSMAFMPDDHRLSELQSLAVRSNIFIIAGAPIAMNANLYIGSFIFKPSGTSDIYIKQYLHSGEEEFFNASFSYNPLVDVKGEKISSAICADINVEEHIRKAAHSGCSMYVSSIFFSLKSMDETHKMLGTNARSYRINILMSNFTNEVWGMQAGGQSAFWDERGTLIGALGENETGLLMVKKMNKSWAYHDKITDICPEHINSLISSK